MAETEKKMGKLLREHYRTLVDVSFGSETPDWYWIGDDVEDMSMELSPSTTTVKNIKGETSVNDEGYEPSASVDTYYAKVGDPLYPKIKDIAFNRLVGDDCKTKMLEIIIDKTEPPFDAWQEDCLVKPQSYGGSQGSINIPFQIIPDGNRKQGTVTISDDGKVTFTEAASATSLKASVSVPVTDVSTAASKKAVSEK